MGGLIAIVVAVVLGLLVGVGGSLGLVASQGGNGYPTQNTGSITVYGNN
jgi:hypothetical protein